MKRIDYITKDCFESEEVYNEYLKLVKKEEETVRRNKRQKTKDCFAGRSFKK